VTTVLVTHDQEEAMEVADRIVVMNGGRVEQVGAPREVYDAPANEFVMGFLGPVARLQGSLVRPHDVGVTTDPAPGAQEAQVLRVVHLGFEVRLELELGDGSRLPVQLARHEAEALEAAEGDIVWIRGPQPVVAAA
jgi:sulfate/thiosulfate transport system ATP-binding protein